jgi:hypothetical protein
MYVSQRKLPGMSGVSCLVRPGKGELIYMQTRFIVLDWPGFSWPDWLYDLKWATEINQDFRCICGDPLLGGRVELHHALCTKNDAKGLRVAVQKMALHNSVNVVAAHAECHADLTRKKCLPFLVELWGREAVESWYEQAIQGLKFPLRSLPF